jgi:hypothetical protein
MSKTLDDIVSDYQTTGECQVDLDLVVKKWNHTWLISQWQDEYTLCKFVRMGTPSMKINVRISTNQASELIDRLNLDHEQSPVFRSGATWRQSDIFEAKLSEFNSKKHK